MVIEVHDPRPCGERRGGDEVDCEMPELKKQVSIFVPLPDYLLLREYAARENKAMNRICLIELDPLLEKLRKRSSTTDRRQSSRGR